jgi:hypothetical protein
MHFHPYALLALVGLASVLAAAAYSSDKVINYISYSNAVSRSFAYGENNNASGWRPCEEVEETEQEIGVVCEGQRSIYAQAEHKIDVNYFCEFQFRKVGEAYRVSFSLCQ